VAKRYELCRISRVSSYVRSFNANPKRRALLDAGNGNKRQWGEEATAAGEDGEDNAEVEPCSCKKLRVYYEESNSCVSL